MVSLSDFDEKPVLVVVFMCNHCPYFKHVLPEMLRIVKDYAPQGVQFVAINSNDIESHPDDSPENMRQFAASHGFTFPYLYDASQEVAKEYQAACTPDFFVFDAHRGLAYRGQMDDSRPKSDRPLTGSDLRKAIDCVLVGTPLPEPQKASIGCNIKWKSGAEPEYFNPAGVQ
jgi:thiol-disulfide isomerase/thioredoxin